MPLNAMEREAERAYDAWRRRARVQVYLNSPDEVIDWKKRAKAAGFSSVGTWIADVCRHSAEKEVAQRAALDVARRQLDAAVRELTFLEQKVALLEKGVTSSPRDAGQT